MRPTIENIKKLFWISEFPEAGGPEYIPRLYLQAKIDFSDVRTGFRETFSVHRTVAMPSKKLEPVWDDDAVLDINPEKLGTNAPERISFASVPEYLDAQFISWVETQFIQYLFRHFSIKVHRNYNLDVYSFSGESRNDFIIRCLDLSKGSMHREFDSLHGVFIRKLERLRQKYLGVVEDSEELEGHNVDSKNRELFNWITERISALFLRTEFSIQRVSRPSGNVSQMHELEERLQSLHFDAQEVVTKILDSYEEKVKYVDEYILHPTMKDIHFVSSCILWMPEGAV